jgi:putative acetyltransferase
MNLRLARQEDISELQELYYGTITTINPKDYCPEQIVAWASTANRTESLSKKINEQYFYVAENERGQITGFASLEKSGYLDFLYIHKDYQDQGIASLLVDKLLQIAASLNLPFIESDVSITAKPFFEKRGFKTIRQQIVMINGVALTNFKMQLERKVNSQ